MQTNEIQELLLDTIPAWHYWFARPFKRMLNDGVSLDMYYCIQSMRRSLKRCAIMIRQTLPAC